MDDIAQHYRTLFKKYGDSPQAVQWTDATSQERRFEILTAIADLHGSALMDFGCGTGQLVNFLERRNISVHYTGIDVVDEMLTHASKKFPAQRFCRFEKIIHEKFDYVLISGVFNNKMADNRSFYRETLKKCFSLARRGLAFNMMSTHVDYFDAGLFYEDPSAAFDFVKRELSPYATLRHDYLVKKGSVPYEFAIYVYRDPRP